MIELKDKLLKWIKPYLIFIIISSLLLFVVEWMNHPYQYHIWLFNHLPQYLLNLIIYTTFYVFLYKLIRRFFLSTTIFSFFIIILGIINYYKMNFKGEPFMIWDILNAKAAFGVAGNLKFTIPINVIIAILVALACSFYAYHQQKQKTIELPSLGFKTLILSFLSLTLSLSCVVIPDLIIKHFDYKPILNYTENGFAVGLITDVSKAGKIEPKNYSEEEINKIIQQSGYYPTMDEAVKPNLIVIMNESWSDLRTIDPNLKFNEEPLPTYISDPLVQSGQILTSIYGGYTANTEFEFLTGHSMSYLPNGSVPYQHYLTNNNCQSIVQPLNEMGYKTIAMHPYDKEFWKRDQVYPCFGFNQFLDIDNFNDARSNKFFVLDDEVANKTISLYEEHKLSDEKQPLFMFAVTMENHTPHTSNENPHIFPTSEVPEGVYEDIAAHASNSNHADKMFKKLMDYFSTKNEPTIIMMFGDHHPAFATKINPEYELNHNYLTPYIAYSNYESSVKIPKLTNPSFLSAYMFELASLPKPFYVDFNYQQSKKFSAYNPFSLIDLNGKVYLSSDDLPIDLKKAYENHYLLIYDTLFGEQYQYKK